MKTTPTPKKAATNNAPKVEVKINFDAIAKLGILFKAISHPLRLKMIKFIDEATETNVNVIYNTLKLEQSITSQHLKVLRGANVVKTRRDGKKIFYKLNYELLESIENSMDLLSIA